MDTDTPDTRLQGLALAWLATRSEKKAGTRNELAKTLHAFVEHRWSRGEWNGRFDALLTELLEDKQVEARGRSGLALTGAGRQQALKFLRVDSPKGLTWKRVKQQHLLAKGLGLPASKPALGRLSDADGVRALVLKRAHKVEGPETPTLAQVRDRLLWRQLGVETDEAFSLRAVQAHLLGQLLGQEVRDPKRGVEQLAARAVGAPRVDAEVVRMAALREWVLAEAEKVSAPRPKLVEAAVKLAPKVPPTETVSFARRVLDAAKAVPPTGRFGDNKVFISHVWKALQPEWADRPAFNEALLAANRAQHLSLGRADLLAAMNPQDITESEVRAVGASFHFVIL
ncbi:hypothetical protein D7X30_23620 [Corallococcus sp. AB011P]|uniref:hypothetical protein n=1 Tax=unclassified Corallococcus TaxID=2685029 RepID=UPI000EA3D405|nr:MULTISPECIES: hypothetical protein [unclassified Corallococcus]RKG56638.1 hypothetical protein D7X30_23620 [Corallococcus sp. AB011P]RKH89417.1 hypothetical protein D7Y21_10875 [Corallococcus sp. AB045]